MVEPMDNETKDRLNAERVKLVNELNSVEKKLHEFDKLVGDLKETREEITRRISAIDSVFREFKDDKKKAGW